MEQDRRLETAYTLHRAGRVAEAAQLCDAILRADPRHIEALCLSSQLRADAGDARAALALLDTALGIDPRSVRTLCRRAYMLHRMGRSDEALAGFDAALAIEPDFADALNGRGALLAMTDRPLEALATFDAATRAAPGFADAWSNRGHALLTLGRFADALASYDKAEALGPRGRFSFHRAVALDALGRPIEALAAYDAALRAAPGDPAVLERRGTVFSRLHRYADALADYDKVLAVRPGGADFFYNRANALAVLKRYEEAVADAKRALAIDPDYALARGILVLSKLHLCDWDGLAEEKARISAAIAAGQLTLSPFDHLALSDSRREQRRCAQIWSEALYPPAPAIWTGERYRHERIRLAYVSADFRNHPVALQIAGVFETHRRDRFETYAVSIAPGERSPIRTRLEAALEHFADMHDASDEAVARTMRAWEIDIAIDLTGHTRECRPGIFAFRPTPVQAHYLGYAGTMGAPYYDYILADTETIPAGAEDGYTENIVRLPVSFMPNDSKRTAPPPAPTRAEAGLPERGFVFCAFNASYKIAPAMFDVWMRLLAGVPESVLWLSRANTKAMEHLRREAEARGVGGTRLIFAPFVPRPEDHFARLGLADLFLDTLPYGAHSTGCDALWAGVPVLTCRGGTFAGRVGASLVTAAGLSDLATDTLAAYETRARHLADHPEALAAIRTTLCANRATLPLFDTLQNCRHLEAAYEQMWDRWQRGETPAPFAVAPDPEGHKTWT